MKCGELSEQVGDKVGLIRSLILRGGFYRDFGKYHEALRISQRGMNLSDQFSAEIRYAIGFYQNASLNLSSLGFFESARAFQLEAIKMAEETKSPRLRARSYIHLGAIYGKWKKYDEAISSIQRGIAIGRELAHDETGREFVHIGLLYLGNVYREAGRYGEALKAFDEVMGFYQRTGRQIFHYAGLKGKLLTFIAQENVPAARVELDRVIRLYENYRQGIHEESNRNIFFDKEQGIYDVAIDFAYTKLDDPLEALRFSELCRARSLLDTTNRGWKSITGPEAPDLKIETGFIPEGPDQIRMRMPDQIQLIEYAVVENRLIIWLISKAQIESREVKISETDLTARVKQYLELVSQPPGRDNQIWQERAADLYDNLIRPIEGLLDRRKQLCIIPDKILNRLPFGTLIARESGKLLLDEFRMLHSPSANFFLSATEKARQKSGFQQEHLLAVGNPDFFGGEFPKLKRLPSAEREAVAIAAYYKAPTLLVNSQAKKNVLIRELERADVVHLALHYEANSWSPMLSRMPMASSVPGDPEGSLHLYELYQLKSLQPRLVVLSACQTTAEDYMGGEGAIGVSRPFEASGIPLVVASLWPVDSVATSDLMIEFHRARKQSRLSTVDALKTAQLELFNKTVRYRHP
ncbi:MAG: CHAT domain-containing tetratricopeptide repeat protein, partial [Acidobacteria bacterium]|nr:CHAT domain-containing tetratricopeptide repeat protein [Acidobacteriota bacterium]